MVTRIKRLSILQTGKFLAVLYGFFSVILLPIMLIVAVASPDPSAALPILIMLVLYPIMGFIAGIIGAALYNLASRIVGGMEITLESAE